MKKALSIIAGLAIGASAFTLQLHKGWNLKGSSEKIDVSVFNNPNIKSVWAYDDVNHKWKVYMPGLPASFDFNKHGVEKLTQINPYDGFWINALNDVTIDTDNVKNSDLSSESIQNYSYEGQYNTLESFEKFLQDHNLVPIDYNLDKTTLILDSNKVMVIGIGGWEGKGKLHVWDYNSHDFASKYHDHFKNIQIKDNIYVIDSVEGHEFYIAPIKDLKNHAVRVVVSMGNKISIDDAIVLPGNVQDTYIWDQSSVINLFQESGIKLTNLNLNDIMQNSCKDQKGCLLYTSPSPRDRQKSRMPSSA
jgi:hypothetical protein